MKCRHCGMELEEGQKICSNCNLPVAKPKVWQIVLVSALAFIVAFVLALVIMKDQGVNLGKLDPSTWFSKKTVQTQTNTPSGGDTTETPDDEESPLYKYGLSRNSYTVTGDGAAEHAAKVAAKIGDVELTNANLQAYYWYGVYNFVTQYESYLSYYGTDLKTFMGLDVALPLDQQTYMDEQITWQRFFLEAALADWHKYTSLALQAEKEGYVMSQEMTDQMNNLLAQVEEGWKQEGYESVDAMIKAELGPLCDEESYRAYLKTYYYAMGYFESKYDSFAPTDEEIEAYYTEHASELEFTKENKAHAVRHILIMPKGGTEDESGNVTYSEEEWEACRAEAQAILDSWKSSDGTEEGFAKLATEKSEDGGSSSNGGLYEDLDESTNFVTEFKEWYLDASRKAGDTGLVKTTYGYHIMYYSAGGTIWQENCRSLAWQAKSDEFVQNCMVTWPVTAYDDQIAIGEVAFAE